MRLRHGAVREFLTAHFKDDIRIAALYLYGSFPNGPFGEESDLDLGILFREGQIPNSSELFDLQTALSEKLKIQVDLACLNQAGPILNMQVLRKGEKILEKDSRSVHEYFVRTVNGYDDLKRVRKPIEQNILNGRRYG